MIYLLYGEDTTRSRAVLQKFILRFEREAKTAWRRVNCEDDDAEERIAMEIGSHSLFADKDYCVFEYASALSEKAARVFEEMLSLWAVDQSVVVCFERGVPKGKLFSKILTAATKKDEFHFPDARALRSILKKEFDASGRVLTDDIAASLALVLAQSPERFYTEMEKALLGGEVFMKDAVLADQELFALGDAWGKRERLKSVAIFEKLVAGGLEPDSILRTFLWHVRNLALATHKKAQEISSPFVARKAAAQAQNFSQLDIDGAYFTLMSISDPRGKDFLETRLLHFLLTT